MGAREGQDEPDGPGLWARCLGAPRHRRGEQAGLARPRRKFSKISSPQTKKMRLAHRARAACCRLFVVYKPQRKTRPRKPPLALAGLGTREERARMTANARAKEEEGELKEGGLQMGYHFIDGCHQSS